MRDFSIVDKEKVAFQRTLLHFRAKHGLTQKQLCEILGCSKNGVYLYENGESLPTRVHQIMYENKMKEWEESKQ